MASWLSSSSASATSASATVGRTSVLLREEDSHHTPIRTGGASKFSKVHKDLLAIVEEDPDLDLSEASVEADPTAAARVIMRQKDVEIKKVMRLIRHAQQLHIAFVVDTTGSMAGHIEAVKTQIGVICAGLADSSGQRNVSVAFVGYKDFCDGPNHFEVLPFTKDIASFQAFVGRIHATGGGDTPEDVNGGLRTALDALEWESLATNVLFHIGDAPPHGSEYSTCGSSQVSLDGMKSDEPIRDLFGRMRQHNIDYYFGKIHHLTDGMVTEFSKACGRAIDTFDVKNPGAIAASVTSAAMASRDSRVKESMSGGRRGAAKTGVRFVTSQPRWDALAMKDGQLVTYKLPKKIQDILDYKEFERTTTKCRIKIAANPFAEGSVRLAFYARQYFAAPDGPIGTFTSDDIVCKTFKFDGRTEAGTGQYVRFRYMIDMEVQTIASYLALKYNALQKEAGSNAGYRVRYLKSKVVAITDRANPDDIQYYAVEKRFREGEDKWVKVINNAGAVATVGDEVADRAFSDYLTAFAHWTYSATNKYLLVTDLQGIKVSAPIATDDGADEGPVRDTILLTDPAIHCRVKTRFGRTNLGTNGMKLFFDSHKCNRFCAALHLEAPPTRTTLTDGGDSASED